MLTLRTAEALAVPGEVRRCERCGCRLSRYNSGRRCSACSRREGGESAMLLSVPQHVWEAEEVQRALMERDFGTLCLLIRRLGALRQEDVARLTGLSQPFLSMLEAGVRKLTNIDKIVRLLDGLEVPLQLTGPMLRASGEGLPPCVGPDGPLALGETSQSNEAN